jgi:hypothetical protein
MYAYILIAIITLVDGHSLPDLPLGMYDSREICMEQAFPPAGRSHIEKIRTEWEVHKLEQAETRDIDTVFLTCDEIVIEHLWETPDGQKHQWPNPKHQML